MNFDFKYIDVVITILLFISSVFITYLLYGNLDLSDFNQCLHVYVYFLVGLILFRFG